LVALYIEECGVPTFPEIEEKNSRCPARLARKASA